MTKPEKFAGFSTDSNAARDARISGRKTCLFVGDAISFRRAALRLPISVPVEICQIFDVTEFLADQRHPDLILSFAITPLFDCLDLANLLCLHGFRNRQRIIDIDLPDPALICREVRLACPALDFGVLDPDELGPR